MGLFEMGMLLCFGAAWPVSIYKSWMSKRNTGKSLGFLLVVFVGYLFGILHKINESQDFVLIFYVINTLFVLTDIIIFIRNGGFDNRMGESIGGGAANPTPGPHSVHSK